jgi:tripeptide aminopeptidase
VKFVNKPSYPSFKLSEDSSAVARAKRAVESLGLTPNVKSSNGGLDANWLVNHGMPTVTFGAGQYEIHTVKEYVDLAEFAQGCRLAIALATLA